MTSGDASGTGFRISNTSPGGATFNIVSTGASSGGGPGRLGFFDAAYGNFVMSLRGGKVGVGTATPDRKLHVDESVAGLSFPVVVSNAAADAANYGPAILFAAGTGALRGKGALAYVYDSAASWNKGDFHFLQNPVGDVSTPTLANSVMTIKNSGNVGIGNTNPGAMLDVAGNVVVGSATGGQLSFGDKSSFNTGIYRSSVGGAADALNVQGLYRILFNTGSFASPAERMRIDTSGNVGIGTTTPAQRLHVVGNIVATGSIAATYQDVAEWVEASAPADAGTVVVADGENQVRPSLRSYDTAVAGVVSPQPGVLLGEAGPGKVMVAQSGRVKVKVDASYGAIRTGDLLVTSPRAGFAMRSEPVAFGGLEIHRPGTILGKALGSLETGEGEVLVLITLQ